jgi:pyruvate kinase
MKKVKDITQDPSQTKIVATIGPACSSKDVLKNMIIEGIDVCRLNFSHGTHDDHHKVIKNITELNNELHTNVAILADLQGPKIRIGEVKNNHIELKENEEITLTTRACTGTSKRLYVNYTDLAKDAEEGEYILINDGKIKLQVLTTNNNDEINALVVHGGELSSKKGVNLPDTKLSQPSLTEKDKKDAMFALEQGVDWIALSFVRSVTDIIDLRRIIRKAKKQTSIIAKIEKPEALNEIDEIIDAANGIMVARGDLGVEVPFDRVPVIQKQIVNKCLEHAKPVIIATQMMESMIDNFSPTRAEANDVANAVIDGADALMLSGETSVGKYPVQVIRNMQKIIDWTETNGFKYNRNNFPKEMTPTFFADSICYNASMLAQQTRANAIITFTHSGYTAYRIASHRPKADIFAFTNNRSILRKLSLIWGVQAFYYEQDQNIEDAIKYSIRILKEKKIIKDNDAVIHVGSTPHYQKGKANMLRVSYV